MNKQINVIWYMILMLSTSLYANVYIEDGLSHTIDDDIYINETVWLDYNAYNNPGTHVDLVAGGVINNFLYSYNISSVDLTGGYVGGLWMYNDSSAMIKSGDIGVSLTAYDNSEIIVDGGTVDGEIHATDTSKIYMNNGSANWLLVTKQGQFNLSGGAVDTRLVTRENGTIYLKGANFEVAADNVVIPLGYGDRLSDYGVLSILVPIENPRFAGT